MTSKGIRNEGEIIFMTGITLLFVALFIAGLGIFYPNVLTLSPEIGFVLGFICMAIGLILKTLGRKE